MQYNDPDLKAFMLLAAVLMERGLVTIVSKVVETIKNTEYFQTVIEVKRGA